MTPTTPEQQRLDAFLLRAKFSYGWANLESSARRMVEHAVDEIEALTKERDALTLGNRDLIDRFDALKSDHDKLMAAAKLALDALTEYASVFENATDPETPAGDAIDALRRAGVQ